MKAIKIGNNDNIVVLDNVRRIAKSQSGSGAKSNPYIYYVKFFYLDGETDFIKVESSQEQDKVMEEIYEILTEEA